MIINAFSERYLQFQRSPSKAKTMPDAIDAFWCGKKKLPEIFNASIWKPICLQVKLLQQNNYTGDWLVDL
jgi:hypothetical protein